MMEKAPGGLLEAVEGGNELEILRQTRRIVAEQLAACESGRDIAALSKQMQDLTAKIVELEKIAKKATNRNGLAAARKAANRAR